MHSTPPVITTNGRLRYRLNFGEADLKANDSGRLSARQRRNLWLKFVWQYIYLGYVIIGFGLCGLLFYGASGGYSTQEVNNAPGTWLLVGGFFILIALPIVFITQYEIYRDLQIDRVLRYRGFVHPDSKPWETHGRSANPPEYWITIRADKEGSVRLNLTKRVFEAFIPGDAYLLYYTPRSKTLVAAQHLPEESPLAKRPHLPHMTRRERRKAQQKADS